MNVGVWLYVCLYVWLYCSVCDFIVQISVYLCMSVHVCELEVGAWNSKRDVCAFVSLYKAKKKNEHVSCVMYTCMK